MFVFLGKLASVIRHSDKSIIDAWRLPEKRGCDDFGCGHYLAPRGGRLHQGEDFKFKPGKPVRAFRAGVISKHGWPYFGDDHYRYVQVSENGIDMQYHYVVPALPIGSPVEKSQIIGYAQDIARKYNRPGKTMINHVHYQIKVNGQIQNPNDYL